VVKCDTEPCGQAFEHGPVAHNALNRRSQLVVRVAQQQLGQAMMFACRQDHDARVMQAAPQTHLSIGRQHGSHLVPDGRQRVAADELASHHEAL
jgi:hypothetical protein